jgi:hypothetical protein
MLSFLLGVSIKFERNAFKVEKSKKDLGVVCQSDLFWALYFLLSSFYSYSSFTRYATTSTEKFENMNSCF